jgi:hypothetical protein
VLRDEDDFRDEGDNEDIEDIELCDRESRSARQLSAAPPPLGEQPLEILASCYRECLAVDTPHAPQAELAPWYSGSPVSLPEFLTRPLPPSRMCKAVQLLGELQVR